MSGGNVNITFGANASKAVREVGGFRKEVEKLSKTLGGFTGMGMGHGGGHSGVPKMSKEMEVYGRAAKRANDDLKALLATQSKLAQAKGLASGDALKDLERQEKYLNRRISQQTVRTNSANTRYETAAAAGHGGEEEEEGHGRHEHGPLKRFAEATAEGLAGPLIKLASAAGLAELLVHSIHTAVEETTTMADLLPRIGGEGAEGGFTKLRRKAMDYGFNPHETASAAGNVSLGGASLKNGLASDTLGTMALSRMFGLDLGGESAMMGQAGRQGAFHPGDARKFAEMLASAIHKTGMDPRALEIQEGTLTLMNRQLATMPSANPGAALALQTVFNRSGIPALQGQNGVGMLTRMQGMITGNMDDPHQAFFQAAMRRAGLGKGFMDMIRLSEQGPLGNPKILQALVSFARTARGKGMQSLVARDNLGIPVNVWEEGEKRGLWKNIASGKGLKEAKAFLADKGVLHEGAEKAGDLAGNKFRRTMASVDNMIVDAGSVVINPLTKLADGASNVMQQIAKLENDAKLSGEKKVGAGAEILAGAAGLDPKTAKRFGRAVTQGVYATERGADWAGQQLQAGDAAFPSTQLPPGAKWDARGMRWYVPQPNGQRKSVGYQDNTPRHVVIEHHHYEHGVVSEASKHAVKKTIRQAAHEEAHQQARMKPNMHYTRP